MVLSAMELSRAHMAKRSSMTIIHCFEPIYVRNFFLLYIFVPSFGKVL